jgi:flagellar basal body-associated protein FliL
MSRKKRFAGQILLGISVIASVLLLFAQNRIDIPLLSLKETLDTHEVNGTRCVLEFNSGDQNLLIKFLVPCVDQRQWDEVTSKMVRVKHECLMALFRPDTAEFIRQRNYEALRKVLVRALNGVVSQPVNTIYFENVTSY